MITRVVKMHFHADTCDTFEKLFQEKQSLILQMPGCQKVELLKDVSGTGIYFTISHWDDEASLEQYRASVFFKHTWTVTKALFNERAQAWSLTSC